MVSIDEILQGQDGKPFPGLLQYFYPALDYDKLLREVEAIPEDNVEGRMKLLADRVPGLPLLADCLAREEQLKEKQGLNGKIVNRLGSDEPGTNAQVPGQSYVAYNGLFDNLLAKSPVLTPADIEEVKAIPLPSGGTAYLFELLKTTRSTGAVTEWHWLAIVITNQGQMHFLEGVWNLYSIESANKDEELLANLYGDSTKNFKRMPAPDTTFQRFHGGTAIGPEDMTLGGEYQHDRIYAVNSEKAFGWDAVKEGRPMWVPRNVLEFRNLSPERLGHFIAVASLVKKSNDKGAPLSTGTHYILNSCLTLQIAALFYDDPELENKPLHKLMLKLGEKADVIHMSMNRSATVEEFLDNYLKQAHSTFAKSNLPDYECQIKATMSEKTLRQSHDGQPPVISCYFANHRRPDDPAAIKLHDIAVDLTLKALRKMAADRS